ncbi:MAG: hypothetical protein P8H13_02880 [Polaribacter sp.]|nr:hypothetical protein [Polaribacter sp.]MDG1810868.1 hypothetical protein [Polaribacter sp.]MDG1993143.1 hypothetical protein [Polaribacter sp.]
MKTNILTFLIAFAFLSCNAQNDHLNHVTHDKVKFNNLFNYDTNPNTIKNSIGNPISITLRFSELQDTNVTVYNYNGLKIDFINNIIYDFEITNNTYSLFIDGLEIKVGNHINTLENKFPKSYNQRTQEGISIIVNDWDSWILINTNNNLITKIEHRNF